MELQEWHHWELRFKRAIIISSEITVLRGGDFEDIWKKSNKFGVFDCDPAVKHHPGPEEMPDDWGKGLGTSSARASAYWDCCDEKDRHSGRATVNTGTFK